MVGFIKLHRKIKSWEWFDDKDMFYFWINLLMDVNYEDKRWHGRVIKRGQIVTSLRKLAKRNKLTIRHTRTILTRLISTHEITHETTNKFTLITVNNYDTYADYTSHNDTVNDTVNDKQTTNKRHTDRQTNDKQTTTTKEIKEVKEIRNKRKGKRERALFILETLGKEYNRYDHKKTMPIVQQILGEDFWIVRKIGIMRLGEMPIKSAEIEIYRVMKEAGE